jgi:hypothetical protein
MGLTIGYYHVTKDFGKIQQIMRDFKAYAENTGRFFRTYAFKGVVSIDKPFYDNGSRNPSFNPGEHDRPKNYTFYDWSLEHLRKSGPVSQQIGFEIEVKSGSDKEGVQTLSVAWFKVGNEWIAQDWHKLYTPATEQSEQLVNTVIEMVSMLEYIKRFYFPSFHIDDEFDFHTDWDDVTDSQKEFWRDIKAGKRPNYRMSDGSFPDYAAEHKALKNHDVANIYRSFGEMDKVFGMMEGELKKLGYTDEMIGKGVPIMKGETGISKTTQQIGEQMVENYIDNIRGIAISASRPRIMRTIPQRSAIERVMLTRKDGVPQHYHKRIGQRRES